MNLQSVFILAVCCLGKCTINIKITILCLHYNSKRYWKKTNELQPISRNARINPISSYFRINLRVCIPQCRVGTRPKS